jgi:hypothetical protein
VMNTIKYEDLNTGQKLVLQHSMADGAEQLAKQLRVPPADALSLLIRAGQEIYETAKKFANSMKADY